MSVMIFYEKPGCLTNRRQKALLQAAGIELEVRDLLAHPWTAVELEAFLQSMPVRKWFNPAAPAVRDGAIESEDMPPEQALAMLIREPILIRRPLLQWQGQCTAGFDIEKLGNEWGLDLEAGSEQTDSTLDQCSRTGTSAGGCP